MNLISSPLPDALKDFQSTPLKFVIEVPSSKKQIFSSKIFENIPCNKLRRKIYPEETLYVAFTSGTTGSLKEIIGTYGPVIHFFNWQERTFGINCHHRVSLLSGLSHDPILRDILMPLWVGATVCIPPQDCFQFPGRLYDWIGKHRINIIHLTPSMGHLLLIHPNGSMCEKLNNLQCVFFGGSVLKYGLVRKLFECAPGATVVNCYGATETPQVMGYYVLSNEANGGEYSLGENGENVPIGRGIDNCQLLILNENNRLCAVGETGEICVRTPYRAKEILDYNGRDAEQFFVNPYTSDRNDLIYKTGDFGLYLPEGSVQFIGRKDKQIKIRGNRIELGDIEQVLSTENTISQYYLCVKKRGEEEPFLVAYVVPSSGCNIDQTRIRSLLCEHLPFFMVPEKIICIEKMPLTLNGKVDEEKLRSYVDRVDDNNTASIDKESPISEAFLELARGIINDLRVKLEDDVINSGISSLQAIELSCAIEEKFNVSLSVNDIVQSHRFHDLVEKIIARQKSQLLFGGIFGGYSSGSLGDSSEIHDIKIAERAVDQFNLSTNKEHSENKAYNRKIRLIPKNEKFFVGVKNRLLQLFARIAPDVWRVALHKHRGVCIGKDVSIGYDTILETSYPWLVQIGDHVNIGMRVMIIAHFRGMADITPGSFSVDIGDSAFIGPGVIVLPNVVIGEGAVIAAGSVVNANIPPYTLAMGNPAKPIARCGLSLSGSTRYSDFIKNLRPIQISASKDR